MTRTLQGRDPASGRVLAVTTDGPVISHVTERPGPAPADLPFLTPGLVDLQVNGFAGHDVNGEAVEPAEVVALTRALARSGTTTYVPTVVTATEPDILRSLRAVVTARRQDPATAHAIPFIHLAGAHLSDQDAPRGSHPPEQVRPADLAEFARWQEAAEGLVGVVTICPDDPGAVAYAEALTAAGVLVAVGHTPATATQLRAVVDAGARLSTPLGGGAHAPRARHPDDIRAQLAEDRLTTALVADGHHLPAETLTVMLRAKGPDRAVLVSGSVAPGGRVEPPAEGQLSGAGAPHLAGAARPLVDGVAGAVRLAGLTLAQALALATLSPGRLVAAATVGRPPGARLRGLLTPGAPADVLLFDHPGDGTLTLREVLAAGRRP